jgi:methylated-DNA-[protein]-cysteine S-methyltransferase
MPPSTSTRTVLRTPFGDLILCCEQETLTAIQFGPYRRDRSVQGIQVELGTPPTPAARALIHDLTCYFSGVPTAFSTPLDLSRHTGFQRAVWKAIQAIPYGRTITYGQLAAGLGDRNAARAVGAALGQNPFPILIPCHRAVGSDGSLTGFGGGLEWKRALLSLESGQTDLLTAEIAEVAEKKPGTR